MRQGRLVFLSDYFGAGGAATGGAGIAALNSFEILAGMGARVQLVSGYFTPNDVAQRPDVTLMDGEDLRSGVKGAGLKAIYNPAARRALAPLLNDLDPATTVIVLHQWTRWLSPSVIALLSPFKLLIYMHDYFWFCPNGAYYNFRTQQPCDLKPMGMGCIACACDRSGYAHKLGRVARQAVKSLMMSGPPSRRAFLHISEVSRTMARELLPEETHRLVHNPLPDALLTGLIQAERAPVYDVGYFGRLEPEKGVMDLCEAVQRSGRRAVFVGSGSLEASIVERLGPGAVIDWAGHAEALALMQHCRVVALPSRWPETWGLVVAEAMAQGRPVLVSSRAGASELVARFGGGAVFDPGQPHALDAALEGLLRAPDARLQTPPTAAHAVRSFLDPGLHGRRILDTTSELWSLDVGPRTARPQPMKRSSLHLIAANPGASPSH